MDELIQQVVAKVGIDPNQAKGAVDTVLAFLKERLPAPIAGQLDAALAGGGIAGLGSQAQSALGGILGGGGGGKGDGGTGGGF